MTWSIQSLITKILSWVTRFKVLKRIPAGALQLTLGISLIIAVICLSMILLSYYSRISIRQHQIDRDLRDNLSSGFHYAMAYREQVPYHQFQTIDLFQEGIDTIVWVRKPWGLYEVISVRAIRGKRILEKSALVTPKLSDVEKSALYLPENNSPLYMAGDAQLEGMAYLPIRGLSPTVVDGKEFTGKQLLAGEKKVSERRLPELDTLWTSAIRNLMMTKESDQYRLERADVLKSYKKHSFIQEKTVWYFQSGEITLQDSLAGNIIIQSDEKIFVSQSAHLADVILIAPTIEIESGFKGAAQLFADKVIRLQDETTMFYPSALGLVGNFTDSLIIVGNRSVVEGQIIIPGYEAGIGRGVVRIEEEAVVHGSVYVNGNTDIAGNLRGHLSTSRISTSIKGNQYMNHIVGATISSVARSKFMPGSFLWLGGGRVLTVAKWIE